MKSDTRWGLFWGLVIVLVGSLYVGSTYLNWSRETSGDIGIPYQQAYEMLQNADEIVIKGDLDKLVQKPSIWVDGQYLGNLLEKGIIDWHVKLLIGKDEVFDISYADMDSSAPKLCTTDNFTSTRYAYHYPQKNIAGYAEDTSVQLADGTDENVYFLYRENLERKPYFYSGNNGWRIYGMDGKQLVTASYDYHSWTSTYTLTLTSHSAKVDLEDKIFLCAMLISSIEGNHHQG